MRSNFSIREIKNLEEMVAMFNLILYLNPGLTKEVYKERLKEMLDKGYRQVGVFKEEQCIGLSGFWVNTKIYCGKFIEPDNVVVDPEYRSNGIGKMLSDWLLAEGKRLGCKVAVLDAYVQNKDAHRFYFREGYTIVGFHMINHLD
jgi:GNAT superfamily N-acetyltransferase